MTDHTTARRSDLPDCDLCKTDPVSSTNMLRYDAATPRGWAYLCQTHFERERCRLGLGRGQRLISDAEDAAQKAVDAASADVLRNPTSMECQDAFLAAHGTLMDVLFGANNSPVNEAMKNHPAGKGRQ